MIVNAVIVDDGRPRMIAIGSSYIMWAGVQYSEEAARVQRGQQSNGACHAIAVKLILIQKSVRPPSLETPHGQHFV